MIWTVGQTEQYTLAKDGLGVGSLVWRGNLIGHKHR